MWDSTQKGPVQPGRRSDRDNSQPNFAITAGADNGSSGLSRPKGWLVMAHGDPAARTAAFELLREVVQEWHRTGRRAYGASLKPGLKQRTVDSFDEAALGFGSFKAFLVAAEQEGYVEMHPAPSGPDVQVVPIGETPIEPPIGGRHAAAGVTRIRDDLWKAWVDWDTSLIRYYDRDSDQAIRLPREETALDSPAIKEWRRALSHEPDHFTPIEPVGFEEQVGWMREFANRQPPEVKVALLSALDGPRPAGDFAAIVHHQARVAGAWRVERVRKVSERIRDFQREHGLDFLIDARPRVSRDAPTDHKSREGTRLPVDERRLRVQLHGAIDAMPMSELLALRVPLEYLVEIRHN